MKLELPNFKIDDLEIKFIQGPMGVGISGANLSAGVANEGGAGIIAAVALGLLRKKSANYLKDNQTALRNEIRFARELSPKGVLGVNIMYALSDHKELIKIASKEDINIITAGAGLPLDLPDLVKNKDISLIPIVSKKRTAELITKVWKERYNYIPSAIIVEGPEAGGHLGFKFDDLVNKTVPKLENIAKEVIDFANKVFDKPIPVIVAGGIYTGQDIMKYQTLGAAGVQMATRFVTTLECDASDEFKWKYIHANKKDIQIIKSPVGLPGSAIMNPFLEDNIKGEKKKFACKYHCLKSCKQEQAPYCIANALVNAQQGFVENEGFVFAGANAYKATKENCLDEFGNFITVKTLVDRLGKEYYSVK
jgi:nitronate monooxygenase